MKRNTLTRTRVTMVKFSEFFVYRLPPLVTSIIRVNGRNENTVLRINTVYQDLMNGGVGTGVWIMKDIFSTSLSWSN